jgi:hypothetical protein
MFEGILEVHRKGKDCEYDPNELYDNEWSLFLSYNLCNKNKIIFLLIAKNYEIVHVDHVPKRLIFWGMGLRGFLCGLRFETCDCLYDGH